MIKLFDRENAMDIFCDYAEDMCLQKAAQDLKSDLRKISGRDFNLKSYLPVEGERHIVVGTIDNAKFASFIEKNNLDISNLIGKWENYIVMTFGVQHKNILICGSDKRGAMWGVYDFCKKQLGVDPLYFWTDNEPKRQEELFIEELNYRDGPKNYKLRGWFINDEDLLTEWKDGGGRRYIDYPFYHQVTHEEIFEKIIETALRLKQNLLIPASFIDIDNPVEENIVRMVTNRGMYITQHHVEPLGVSHFAWDSYWKKRGEEFPASFVLYKEKFEEIWTYYVEKWAKYKDVIWQFGLRGRGDRPVWFHDKNVAPSMEYRGKLISSAIEAQKNVVEKVLGHNDFMCTSTLWSEGAELYKEGYLSFPENTMIIFADAGNMQMFGDDFYSVKRQPEENYGVYYHVAYWDAGPHLVQGTSLEKMLFNYKKAVENGDMSYSILNVANIREMLLNIEANARITWDIDSFEIKGFLKDWAKTQFGLSTVDELYTLYTKFYNSYYKLDSTLIPDQLVLLDGLLNNVGSKITSILKNVGDLQERYAEKADFKENWKSVEFDNLEEFIEFYKNATNESLERWMDTYDYAVMMLEQVENERKQFFIDFFIVQLEVIIGLYSWVNQLTQAVEVMVTNKDIVKYNKHINKAIFSIEKLLMDRKKSEHGKWENWYKGDKKMKLSVKIQETKACKK